MIPARSAETSSTESASLVPIHEEDLGAQVCLRGSVAHPGGVFTLARQVQLQPDQGGEVCGRIIGGISGVPLEEPERRVIAEGSRELDRAAVHVQPLPPE